MTVTGEVDGYRALPAFLAAITCRANSAKVLRSSTAARLYVYDPIIERLTQDLQDMAAALGQLIQEEQAMVGQRHLAGHQYVAAADQPRIRDRMGGAKWARRAEGGAITSEAGNTVDANGLEGFPLAPPPGR